MLVKPPKIDEPLTPFSIVIEFKQINKMSSNIVPPASFDVTKLTFGDMKTLDSGAKLVDLSYDGRRNLLTQTASMSLPYGLNVFDKAGPVSYSVDVSFRGLEENPKVQAFYDMLAAFDAAAIEAAVKNSLAWLGKNPATTKPEMLREIVKDNYTPSIKIAIDRQTGKPKPYPPTLKIKLQQENGNFKTQFYDANKQRIENASVEELLVRGAQGTFLIKCTGLWFAGGKFGASWKGEQARMESIPNRMRGCAILDDDEDEVAAPVAKPAAVKRAAPANRFAVADDDEEEDVVQAAMPAARTYATAVAPQVEDEEEDDVVEAPPLPKKLAPGAAAPKKVVRKAPAKA